MKPAVPKGPLAEFCRRNHIRRLSLFGSVLRDDFGPGSDIDVLVELSPGTCRASVSSASRTSSQDSWVAGVWIS
jgi:predicted nucleotidyltransferase